MNEEFSDLPKLVFVLFRDFPIERFALWHSFLKLFFIFSLEKKKNKSWIFFFSIEEWPLQSVSAEVFMLFFNLLFFSVTDLQRWGWGGIEKRGNRSKNKENKSTSQNSAIKHFKHSFPSPLLQDEKWFQILRKQKTNPSPTKEPCHHAFSWSTERNLILKYSLERWPLWICRKGFSTHCQPQVESTVGWCCPLWCVNRSVAHKTHGEVGCFVEVRHQLCPVSATLL